MIDDRQDICLWCINQVLVVTIVNRRNVRGVGRDGSRIQSAKTPLGNFFPVFFSVSLIELVQVLADLFFVDGSQQATDRATGHTFGIRKPCAFGKFFVIAQG